MGKRKDEDVWNHMEKLHDGVKCKYCLTHFKGRPSESRLKSHLLRTPNQGITLCGKVPDEVTFELAEIDKRRKTDTAGSSLFKLQSGEGAGASGGMGEGGGEEIRVERWEPVTEGNNSEERTTTQGIKLLTAAFVIDSYQKKVDKVWSWLMDCDVQGVGLCGMGGIGKTELAKHINNRLLSDPNPFHHVYWVGVSQDCSIRKLQNAIAEAVDLNLPRFGDENICAAKLREALVEKEKMVLILDDVWEFVDLKRVGIPNGSHACKLIITSRIRSVCRQIGCQQVIKLYTLSEEQSWDLFLDTLGNATTLPTQIEVLARSVVEQCGGLPLGIVTVAECMRGVVDLREWRNVSEELKGSQPRPQIMELFDSLKLSYSALRKPTLKKVLVFCSLVFEGRFSVGWEPKFATIFQPVANKLTGGLESREIEFDDMDHSLRLLEDVGLLQLWAGDVRVHGLVKAMGILIKKESDNVIIEVDNEKLKDLPGDEEWTSVLEEVFLINTNITRIASSHSPNCPRLSSLYLCGNRHLESIGDSFFQYFSGLEVLDLSSTCIMRLPYSVWNLVNLISLNVSYCKELEGMPPVSKPAALKKLDASYSGIVEVPNGMEFLSGLNYLNLFGTGIYDLPDGLLRNLSGLQCLMLNWVGNGVELEALKDLEILICVLQFPSLSESAHMWNVIKRLNLNQYSICIQNEIRDGDDDLLLEHPTAYSDLGLVYSKVVKFEGVLEDDDPLPIDLPARAQCLDICDASSIIWKSIVLQSCAGLRCLCISRCDGLDYLCYFPSSSSGIPFENIEILELSHLDDFLSLFAGPSPEANVPPSPDVFCHLRKLDIHRCPKIVKLFPPNLLSSLQNLEQLRVRYCDAMEVIFEDKDENNISRSYSTDMLNLPKLKILELEALPQLQRISSGKINCESLQLITVADCVKLDDIFIHLPITSIELVRVYPEEWWHTVNWENKDCLPTAII